MKVFLGRVVESGGASDDNAVSRWFHENWPDVVQFCQTNPIVSGIFGVIAAGIIGLVILAILSDL